MRKAPNLFYLDGAEHRRRSGIVAGVEGKCWKCGEGATFFATVQFANAKQPFTGKLCRSCFVKFANSTELFGVMNYELAAFHLSADGQMSEAAHNKLKLRNGAKSTWAEHKSIN